MKKFIFKDLNNMDVEYNENIQQETENTQEFEDIQSNSLENFSEQTTEVKTIELDNVVLSQEILNKIILLEENIKKYYKTVLDEFDILFVNLVNNTFPNIQQITAGLQIKTVLEKNTKIGNVLISSNQDTIDIISKTIGDKVKYRKTDSQEINVEWDTGGIVINSEETYKSVNKLFANKMENIIDKL